MSEYVIDNVPLYEKYCLTIKEAAEVFNIGEHAIRSLTKIPSNNFTLKVGTKTLVKRKLFEDYINTRKEV